jgi:adenine-specific DNA-methyltransferase
MNSEQNKLRGGYYTPAPISEFLAKWAIRNPSDRILEPSCVDGNILIESYKVLKALGANNADIETNLVGVEYYADEAEKAKKRLIDLGASYDYKNIYMGDFFKLCVSEFYNGKLFDVAIGNPPFIRYQNFPDEQKAIAIELMHKKGLRPNRLTNSWLAFLVCSTFLLRRNGRLAMVIPAELFQVNYAAEVRKYLSDFFKRIFIITFKKLIFPDVQQEVVLLLAERNSSNIEGINVIEVNDASDLARLKIKEIKKKNLKPIDHNTDKWTKYFLDKKEILLLKNIIDHHGIIRTGEIYEVDVGIVTGQNNYFVLGDNERKRFGLEHNCQKIVTRSSHLSGLNFTESDFNENVKKNYPTFLFNPSEENLDSLPQSVKEYIKLGEQKGVHKGFKCRNRKVWFKVPSVWIPDAFMLRQVHEYPKLVNNSTAATCTDTIHRVRFKNGFDNNHITTLFLNSLTFSFAEITGRSYGGGVLTFEPSEAEQLPIPDIDTNNINYHEIDRLLRKGDIYQILNITDKEFLRDGLGLTKKETSILRNIWNKLKERRIGRK